MLFIQCIVLCIIFTFLILPPLFKNPISQIMSYPPEIRKRVESLPQYKDMLSVTKKKNVFRKIVGTVIAVFLLAGLAYLSGKTTFISAFSHVFILFFVVNLYDLVILDFIVFAHCKKVVIPGTEDMFEAYKNPVHHIKGACKGTVISAVAAVLAGSVVAAMSLFIR
ncbi:hypothetical protein CLHUN_39120 [Ruminiclostridium hungatei]|uniref:Uncharacterized protein n=1 Tax=Ruminiclostridium hungatei TaxID=48256 RepID=A0A1V4SG81_RUMHU|nr:hypothetical protein [Ruminiclostridium hungatei]OPX42261.1 hypothetical protein CLHUN_39120 [Ruminiclostridium hungatei]